MEFNSAFKGLKMGDIPVQIYKHIFSAVTLHCALPLHSAIRVQHSVFSSLNLLYHTVHSIWHIINYILS